MSDSPTRFVSAEVRGQMARAGRTQSDVAEVLGLTATAVSNRLRGLVPWDINELVKVADFLGVPLTDLLPSDKASA